MADKKFFRAGTAALFTLTFSALPAIAATERQLDSHEHGHARINMAISGGEVLAELISPAANVIGFEHMPETDADKQAVADATDMLAKGEQMFTFDSSAECSLRTAEVESELLGDDHDDHDHDGEEKHDDHDDDHHDDEKHDDHDHDGEEKHDDHDDHHDEEKHDDHDHDGEGKHDDDHHDEEKHDDHDHDHDGHDEESHSEFHVTWSFSCAHPEKLETVQVNLFNAFSGFEEIDVSVAGDEGQASFELSAAQSEIKL